MPATTDLSPRLRLKIGHTLEVIGGEPRSARSREGGCERGNGRAVARLSDGPQKAHRFVAPLGDPKNERSRSAGPSAAWHEEAQAKRRNPFARTTASVPRGSGGGRSRCDQSSAPEVGEVERPEGEDPGGGRDQAGFSA